MGLQSMTQGTLPKNGGFTLVWADTRCARDSTRVDGAGICSHVGKVCVLQKILESNPSLPFPCPQVCLLLPPPCSSSLLLPRAIHNTDVVLLIPTFLQVALRKGWGKHSSGEAKHPVVCLIVLVHLSHLMEHPSRTLQQFTSTGGGGGVPECRSLPAAKTRSKRYFSEFSRTCDWS